jgi:hypothetical protein
MDHQGAGRRSAADTRRQPPWPPLEGADGSGDLDDSWPESTTGPIPTRPPGYDATGYGAGGYGTSGYGPGGSGAQQVLGPGTGPQRLAGSGSGAQPVLGSGSGAQPVLGSGRGAHRSLGPGTGPGRLIGSGTGPHSVLHRGSGAQPLLSPGSGPQPALGAPGSPQGAQGAHGPQGVGSTGPSWRTPARGFPPGREPAEPFLSGPAVLSGPAADGYPDDDTDLEDPLAPADGTGPFVAPGRRRGGRTKRRFRTRTWLAAAVVVVAAAGFASYRFLYEPTVNAPVPSTLRLPTTAPGSPGFDKTLGIWQHIGTRAEDPESLTIAGLYPPQFVLNGSSYVRTAASVTKTCSLAVYGADLQAALQSGHCTQVLRASYISGDGKMMGTVGVVNLISSSAAQKAGKVTGPQEIIAPLSGKKGPTSKLGNGTGVVQAEIKGHYLILMWAEFTSLKSPSGQAQRAALEQFAANLVTGSANINLSTRMLTGKP